MTLGNGQPKKRSSKTATSASDGQSVIRGVIPSTYFASKGAVARGMAVILLIPGAPLMSILMVLIRLTSRGPAVYRQTRLGKHGKTFVMYKLRTMQHDAEALTGPVWTLKDDGRVTRLGRLLRRFHLDELPQLINVIKGEMDLVGPRPERPEFSAVLARKIPGYTSRLQVLPGVTGLAQIHLPADSDLHNVRRKLALDLHYIERCTFLLDLRLLAATLMGMVGLKGPYRTTLLGLSQRPENHLCPETEEDSATPAGVHVTPSLIARSRPSANGHGSGNGRAPRPASPAKGKIVPATNGRAVSS
jgi:lipopolysaccharide/colanic/teichoic acid biosynthesis glycosyltransferase